MPNMTDHIASYSASFKYEDLPPEVLHKAKSHLIDALGCAIGAYTSEPAKIARRIAQMVYPCEMPATIIGSGQKSSLDLATFANGVMIRYLDFNDGFSGEGGGHPSENFGPCLTCADAIHASGKDFITASVLAYEIYCGLADRANLTPTAFEQTLNGSVSCAMGVSKLLGLSREQMVQAINLALAPNIALKQTRIGEVSMWKGCAMSNGARNAVFAVLLAKEGMTGPGPIFEGRYGLFNAVSGPFELDDLGGNGNPFRIMNANVKRYPLGQIAQTAIDAALKVRSQISSADEISQVHVGTYSRGIGTMAADAEKWLPKTRETADHSLPYVVAAALLWGPVEKRHFDDEYLHSPALLELIGKIKVDVDDEVEKMWPTAYANRVEVVTRSGKKYSELVEHHRGHNKNPLSNEEFEQKFDSLTRDLLLPAHRKELLSLLWNLEKVEDVSVIMELLKI
ncbi:MAG: MmgE/PrpD family protein [Chloroflexi bacterium]|nr:MmgE/PrpD family protein [Chloroflexota bacterium]